MRKGAWRLAVLEGSILGAMADIYRHPRIFPLDSVRFLPGIVINGVRSAIRGVKVTVITQVILEELTASAQASARLWMNYDLRNSASDGSQRMFNALEPGTGMLIHRHHEIQRNCHMPKRTL